ncbi:unnamed protein product [Mytilus coruscus]|uniref:Uncharacterized protein n=1 Tax=Mytilus coruscus TaxID=42192 RepID=A0A6J8DH11_MYTCO|nr:unnamed protein product [Mytilus coruscus]
MGVLSSKNSENAVDDAVRHIDSLHRLSTDKAKEIIDAMKEMESHVKTLISEKDFLKSKKLEFDKKMINRKDKDEETISEKHSGASNSSSCNIQWNNKQEDDKYIPQGTEQQMEFQYVQSSNDTLNERIQTLENQLVEANEIQNDAKEKYKLQLRVLNDKLEEKEEQHKKMNDTIEKNETKYRNLKEDKCKIAEKLHRESEKLRLLENQYDVRQNTIQSLKLEGDNLKCQLEQKIRDYSLEKQKMDTLIKKERNKLTDMRLTIEKLKNDKETTEKNLTEERKLLQIKIIELQGKDKFSTGHIALLQKENECLKIENNRLMTKAKEKKHISFHSVLKQPQSDQAVNGIFDLLRGQCSDTEFEMVEESKRKKNTPLLVVLYNLSRIADDVKGALYGIEANSDVALVVLHSKDIKKPSEKILTEPDFKKLGIIVDMNFLSAKGIISDDVTDKAIHQLVGFINKF